jgi:hypothetical protein
MLKNCESYIFAKSKRLFDFSNFALKITLEKQAKILNNVKNSLDLKISLDKKA